MTAEEIRSDFQGPVPVYDIRDQCSIENAKVKLLGEIAAQLAELNATLKAMSHNQPVVYVRDGNLGE